MTHSVSTFAWYDLATTDPDAAATFYDAVVNWTAEAVPNMPYTLFKTVGAIRTAGLMALPAHLREAGVPPHWTGYIGVDDVDAMVARVLEAGGSLKYGPSDVPGVGRFAVVADPGGAVFQLFHWLEAEAGDAGMMALGRVGWHELRAADPDSAFGFYAGLFGWTRGRAIDMGPMGTYQLFDYGGTDRGGIMTTPPGVRPHWLFYFVVEAIDAAIVRIETAGGTVLQGPNEVPGGAWVVTARDPQGAPFALVAPGR
ncbi:MAG: VOC family protein [Pseudomonadota bacterium]|nr:VOC family protein [Pseudomonadota bacterium]